MLRTDIDGILVWLTNEDADLKKPALVLDHAGSPDNRQPGYVVFYVEYNGEVTNPLRFYNLKDALVEYANLLPYETKALPIL